MNSEHQFSMGTTPIMDKMQGLLLENINPIDTICINIGTIVRNCLSNEKVKNAIEEDKRKGIETDRPSLILMEESRNEMLKVVQYLAQAFTNNHVAHNPYIITYHADYSKSVQSGFYKTPAHSKRVVTIADEYVRSKYLVKSRQEVKSGDATVVELPIRDSILPWRHLYNELKDIRNNHNVVMITHHPIDYHIGHDCRTFRVVRSFTGDVIDYKNLGKIVFGTDLIPFNIYTHPVFGDKDDVKNTISASKPDIVELAEKEEWKYKTRDYMRERFYKLGIKIPFSV